MTRSQRLWVGYGLLALICAGTALGLVLTSNHEDHPLATIFLGEVLGLSFVLAGLFGRTRRPENRTGPILAGVGFAFFACALSEANASVPFTAGQLLGTVFVAAFVHLLVAYPTGTLATRFERRLVGSAYALAIAFPTVFLLFARGSDICDDCPGTAARRRWLLSRWSRASQRRRFSRPRSCSSSAAGAPPAPPTAGASASCS